MMSSTVYVNTPWLIATAITAIFALAYPLIVGVILRRKVGAGWKYFWFGALVFLVFQLVTRIPAIIFVTNTVLTPLLRTSVPFQWTWLFILAITAGLFEEVGRYLGYRVFMGREPKTWNKAVMFGLGHGGLESMVLVGGTLLITLINITVLSAIGLKALPPTQMHTAIQQLAAINAQPSWFPLLGAWERLWTVPVHVALAVIVLQVFRQKSIRWLFLAIFLHFLVDFTTLVIPQTLGNTVQTSLLVEGVVMVFGLIGIWIIWRLREIPQPETNQTDGATTVPHTIEYEGGDNFKS